MYFAYTKAGKCTYVYSEVSYGTYTPVVSILSLYIEACILC